MDDDEDNILFPPIDLICQGDIDPSHKPTAMIYAGSDDGVRLYHCPVCGQNAQAI